jgi:glycerol kinase
LPEVRDSSGEFGVVDHPDVACQVVPILASVVDQPAAMVGQGCLDGGQIKATYGTGCFINLNTGDKIVASGHGLLTLLAWGRDGATTYGLDGGVFTAAASVNWLRDSLKLLPNAESLDEMCAADSGGALWIPAQIGLGAPYWERGMRGAWLGIDLSTSAGQLVRALLEGIAANVARIVEAMRDDSGLEIKALRADGGLTASAAMMQIQADLLGIPVEVVANAEATAGGVGALALRASGLWESDDRIRQQVRIGRVYEPKMLEDERRAHLARFDRAIERLKDWQ